MGNIMTINNPQLVNKINNLEKKLEILQSENTKLKNAIDRNNSKEIKLENFYNNLDKTIDNYVDEMLEDEEINSSVPDFIEKKMYKKVFKSGIKIFKNITDNTKISFMNHNIKIEIEPEE